MQAYLTIDKTGNSEYTVSRSRFLGICVHVESEEEATSVLASIKKEYWDAKHHCYAYVLGADGGRIRFSDDGEPGGTAGLPILNVIKGKELTNTLVIVTRYFGGILLGTGGLARAYTKAASEAIQNAVLITMEECTVFSISISYPLWPKISTFLSDNCVSVEAEYLDSVYVKGLIRASEFTDFCTRLIDRSDGQLHAVFIEERLMPVKR